MSRLAIVALALILAAPASAGKPAWSDLGPTLGPVAMTSDAATELWTLDFQAAYGAVNCVAIKQTTGNPTAGVLLSVWTTDADMDVMRVTAQGTSNGVKVAATGVLSSVGTGTIEATTALNLAANPADCAANTYATTIAASGALTCAQVSLTAGVTGVLPVANMEIHQTETLGPYYINDLAGSATTQATLGFFNAPTALSRGSFDQPVRANAHVVGLRVIADATRSGGTATANVRIDGTGTTFHSDSVVLDATNTTGDSDMVAHASGLAVTAGQTVGCELVTSSWTPTTADIACWITVSYD